MSESMADISFCEMATDASNSLAVNVFTELIHYFLLRKKMDANTSIRNSE
jgi:hypothetical protein